MVQGAIWGAAISLATFLVASVIVGIAEIVRAGRTANAANAANKGVRVTQRGINKIKKHLARP